MKKETEKRNLKILLFFLIVLLFVINYPTIDKVLGNLVGNYEVGVIDRVIDGDTVVIGNDSIRLLGINSPEKGEPYYKEAKEFLELLVLNNTVKLQKGKEDLDRYDRKLRYLIIGTTNINSEIIKEGLANFYFPSGKDFHFQDFKKSWEECIEEEVNLCQPSKDMCGKCIELKNLNFDEQSLTLNNICEFSCNLENWEIKDEGRKKFIFPNVEINPGSELIIKVDKTEEEIDTDEIIYWRRSDYVWTDSGDTIFLRDDEGNLVLWRNY